MTDEKKVIEVKSAGVFARWAPWVLLGGVLAGIAYGLLGCSLLEPTAAEQAAASGEPVVATPPGDLIEQGVVGLVGTYAPFLAPLALLFFRRVRENVKNVGAKAADLGKAVAAIPGLVHTDDAKSGVEKKDGGAT
jgi:hypothetical protein